MVSALPDLGQTLVNELTKASTAGLIQNALFAHQIDQLEERAAKVQASGCPYCEGPLHAAHFERKPRGGPDGGRGAARGVRRSVRLVLRRVPPADVASVGEVPGTQGLRRGGQRARDRAGAWQRLRRRALVAARARRIVEHAATLAGVVAGARGLGTMAAVAWAAAGRSRRGRAARVTAREAGRGLRRADDGAPAAAGARLTGFPGTLGEWR
jgi:hypothetical protein